jgi:hypothetical protein
MAKKAKKITQEELDKIVKAQKEINEILTQIGAVETQKHGLLHKIAEINQFLEEAKADLEKTYGPVSINLETGEYTKIEKEKELEVVE